MSGETESAPSSWTIDSAMAYLRSLITEADRRYEDHFDALDTRFRDHLTTHNEALSAALVSTKEAILEADRRYSQRFQAQEVATAMALTANEKAFGVEIAAAKTAVEKAEKAQDKRLDSVNEFRGQLSDQAATFMPRLEAEQRIKMNTDRVDDMDRRFGDALTRVNSRLDLSQGEKAGGDDAKTGTQASLGLVVGIVGAVVAVLGLVGTVIFVVLALKP